MNDMSIKEYFSFTKRERSGIIGLLVILLMVMCLSRIFPQKKTVATVPENVVDTSVVLEKNVKDSERFQNPGRTGYKKFSPERKPFRKLSVIEINSADTAAYIALPGIGSKLAARIVAFRDKLGGFYNVGQIGEVYGLQDSVFQKIRPLLRCDPQAVHKIDINAADKDQLKMHPYIRWKIAEALITYRNEHGGIRSRDDLVNIETIDEEDIDRIMPYLSFK